MAKRAPQPGESEPAANTPLAGLMQSKGFTASEEKPEAPAAKPGAIDLSKIGKIAIHRERKGRGGKTVTIISGIQRPPDQLERIAKEMRKSLGCGSTIEEGSIVLLGDIAPRAYAWLQAHGAKQIVGP
jgi:translation initiation factor 1